MKNFINSFFDFTTNPIADDRLDKATSYDKGY